VPKVGFGSNSAIRVSPGIVCKTAESRNLGDPSVKSGKCQKQACQMKRWQTPTTLPVDPFMGQIPDAISHGNSLRIAFTAEYW
jgi:hypothetical protein